MGERLSLDTPDPTGWYGFCLDLYSKKESSARMMAAGEMDIHRTVELHARLACGRFPCRPARRDCLTENGLSATTPAAAIARATRHDEEIVLATIDDLHARLAATPLPGPALVLIGRELSNRAEVETSNCDAEDGVNRTRMDAAGFG